MKHVSDILLHFVARANRTDPVGQLDTCHAILRDGLRFSNQHVDLGSGIGAVFLEFGVPAVCFTDVPLRLSDAHAARYGTCAIGYSKALVKRWGGNPVLYVVDRKEAYDDRPGKREDFRGVFGEQLVRTMRMIATGKRSLDALNDPNHWLNALNDKQVEALQRDVGWTLVSHLKEMFDLGSDVDGEDEQARRDRYYLEREWRVALTDAHRDAAAAGSRLIVERDGKHYLLAPRRDVRVIVLPNDRARGELHQRLQKDHWTPEEMPALITFADSKDL